MFVFLREQSVPLTSSNRGFLDTDKLYFLLHLHEFPTPPLYESSDQPKVFLVRVTDFSCSQNILSILLFSLVTTLSESFILVRECPDLEHEIFWCLWSQSCCRQSSTTFPASMSEQLLLRFQSSWFFQVRAVTVCSYARAVDIFMS